MPQGVDAALIAGSASLTVGLVAAYASARQGRKTRALQQDLADNQAGLQRELSSKQEDLQRGLAEGRQDFEQRLTELTSQLDRQAKEEERRLSAKEALELYRVPLRHAAEDLGHRVGNIRTGGFLAYVETDNRRQEIAVLGTAYRIARFFGTLEMLYDRAEFLQLERRRATDSSTESVLQVLAEIGKTFARDDYDRQTADFRTSQFMVWREEQRAMGEVARDRDRDSIVGFSTFAMRATQTDARWFANLTADLKAGGAAESQRFEVVQSWLAALVRLLDPDKSFMAERDGEPAWMQSAAPDPRAIARPRGHRPTSRQRSGNGS